MAIVQPKHQRWRLLLAHLFLLGLCAAVVFPFACVLSVSLRPGNFASGSLIPLTGAAHGITTEGLHYPLRDATLSFERARGVSNVLLAPPGCVSVREGLLLVVQHDDAGAHQWRGGAL